MKEMSVVDRILLSATGILAGYQLAIGIEDATLPALAAYTVAFGILLLAGVMLLIFGFELLSSPLVVVVATIIPLSLSLGLVWEYLPAWRTTYLLFAMTGFTLVLVIHLALPGRMATILLAMVHGVAGLLIVGLPLLLSLRGEMPAGFALVGIGGALIGVAGLFLSFLRMGKPLLSEETILAILPALLLLLMSAYVAGFVMIS